MEAAASPPTMKKTPTRTSEPSRIKSELMPRLASSLVTG